MLGIIGVRGVPVNEYALPYPVSALVPYYITIVQSYSLSSYGHGKMYSSYRDVQSSASYFKAPRVVVLILFYVSYPF